MAFTEFGSYLQYLRFDSINIDNNVFKLHYKITCMIFLCSSALTLMGQYIGDPIDCMVDGIPGGMMDTYCWIHSTFSIPSRYVIFEFHISTTYKYVLIFFVWDYYIERVPLF